MADHSKPTVTSNYLDFVNEMHGRMDDLAVGLDPERTSATNVPNYSIRWSSVAKKWQYLDGSSWKDLTNEYAINISGSATKLKNARTISITGGGTAQPVPFDGSANVQLTLESLDLSNLTGFGSAATRDVVSSNTDTSGGDKVITQGWMGLGGKSRGIQIPSSGSDLNDYQHTGFYSQATYVGATNGSNYPQNTAGCLFVYPTAGNNGVGQTYYTYQGMMYIRYFEDGSWGPWREIHHTGNILKTTGNDDNYPMSQKAVTDALDSMQDGLGSAATRDVVSSATDTSGGDKVITQGWMGLGKTLSQSNTTPNEKDLRMTGFFGNYASRQIINVMHSSSSGYQAQISLSTTSPDLMWRNRKDGVWSPDYHVYHTGNKPSWGDISGKPSTFSPSSHNHSASNITSGTLPGARMPMGAGGVGTYAFVQPIVGRTYTWNQTVSGGNLLQGGQAAGGYGQLSGSWRILSANIDGGGQADSPRPGLAIRIS